MFENQFNSIKKFTFDFFESKVDEIIAMSINFYNFTISSCFYTNSTSKTIISFFKSISAHIQGELGGSVVHAMAWLHYTREMAFGNADLYIQLYTRAQVANAPFSYFVSSLMNAPPKNAWRDCKLLLQKSFYIITTKTTNDFKAPI